MIAPPGKRSTISIESRDESRRRERLHVEKPTKPADEIG
jgi:hypothetical protein